MFYLGLENQIHLLIIVIFSSYIYLSSLGIKPASSFNKHFGIVFFIPLVLCIMSFLSLNTEHAASYLFFAEFILVAATFLINIFDAKRVFTDVIIFFLYAIPVSIGIFNLSFNSLNRSRVMDLMNLAFLCISFIILISCILLKRTAKLEVYWGIFAICTSLIVVQMTPQDITIPLSLVFKTTGYILFSWYFYHSTIYQLREEHSKNTTQLEKINQSVQREVNRRVEEIERSNRKLAEIAKTDSLTGSYTKKAIMDMMDLLIDKQPESTFSILMFDLDNFKKINDCHGHITGDKCIKNLIAIARSTFRNDDRIGRFGGDEFVIILPGTSPVKAYLVADRFRKSVEATNDPHYTVSIGISSYPLDAKNARGLISAADRALYHSKENGRNMVSHTGDLKE